MPRSDERVRGTPLTFSAVEAEAGSVNTIQQFKDWTRRQIRPVFPHGMLLSGYGLLHATGVSFDCAVSVDFPLDYLQELRERADSLHAPILRSFMATREPQLFEAELPPSGISAAWLKRFRERGLRNVAVHGQIDERRVTTHHSFYRIPGRLGDAHVQALRHLVPIMHKVLRRVLEREHGEEALADDLLGLSSREKCIAHEVRRGSTNAEIAALYGLSENTIKHHLTSVFSKLGIRNRAELIYRLTERYL